MKKEVVKVLEEAFKKKGIKISRDEIESRIEVPTSVKNGDFAFPCFFLAEKLKDSPHQIALELRAKIGTPQATEFDNIHVEGPYINFFVDRKDIARKAVFEAITKQKNYGKEKREKREKIIIEFSSPNISKPLGIHHLRSTIIGNSLANMAEFLGYKPIKINYIGDWGTQFGRILFGFEKFGNHNTLLKNPLKHLMEVYIKASKKTYDKKAKEYFKKLEDKNKESLMLWKVFRERSLEEFKKTYKSLGIKFDSFSGEADAVKNAKKIFEELQTKNLVKKSKKAWIADLKKENLDVVVLVKDDGATTYALRDLATAITRYKKYKFNAMIYETGHEQSFYFKQLFKILESMGHKWAQSCEHVGHGLYMDSSGKKFSTRKGKVVLVEDILDKTKELVKKEISKRDEKISKKELEKRAHKIAIAAIFYGDLKSHRKNNVIFNLKKFVSFNGNTGPYLLYSYARASSVIKKGVTQKKFKIDEMSGTEIAMTKKIVDFNVIVKKAFDTKNPSLIANYCYDLAKLFNEFYQNKKIIGSKDEGFQLALVEAFRVVLRNAIHILGIEVIEKM